MSKLRTGSRVLFFFRDPLDRFDSVQDLARDQLEVKAAVLERRVEAAKLPWIESGELLKGDLVLQAMPVHPGVCLRWDAVLLYLFLGGFGGIEKQEGQARQRLEKCARRGVCRRDVTSRPGTIPDQD